MAHIQLKILKQLKNIKKILKKLKYIFKKIENKLL